MLHRHTDFLGRKKLLNLFLSRVLFSDKTSKETFRVVLICAMILKFCSLQSIHPKSIGIGVILQQLELA
jgi:hypothetical protein